MSSSGAGVVQRAELAGRRVWRAGGKLSREQRWAAGAAAALFFTLFLPWYQATVVATTVIRGYRYQLPSPVTVTGWGAFGWVEVTLILISGGVLWLLFRTADGRPVDLPVGDGPVVIGAGGLACLVVVWRMFDKQGVTSHGQFALSTGIEWGIFVALLVSGLLTYAGTRLRTAPRASEDPPAEPDGMFDGPWREGRVTARAGARAGAGAKAGAGPRAAAGAGAGARARAGEALGAGDEIKARRAREEAATAAGQRRSRAPSSSGWRPAERPEWSEPEHALDGPQLSPDRIDTDQLATPPDSAPPDASDAPDPDASDGPDASDAPDARH